MDEKQKYVALAPNGEPSGNFGATPEEAAREYMDNDSWDSYSEEAPETVTLAECKWFKPTDFTEGLGQGICDQLAEAVEDAGGDYADDIIRGLESAGDELDVVLKPVLDAWFTAFCRKQGGMNFYQCGKETEVPVAPAKAKAGEGEGQEGVG